MSNLSIIVLCSIGIFLFCKAHGLLERRISKIEKVAGWRTDMNFIFVALIPIVALSIRIIVAFFSLLASFIY